MKLKALIGKIPGRVETLGDIENTESTALRSDSRRVVPGDLFFCTPGLRMDAHDFAPQAVEKGAAALVVERRLEVSVPQVIVEDVRVATSYIAAAFYGHPADEMLMLGITGTKGKTTTSNTAMRGSLAGAKPMNEPMCVADDTTPSTYTCAVPVLPPTW